MSDKKREQLIVSRSYKKSNELINAMGKGTALSQKLFAIGMQNMKVDDTNNVVATIYGSELRKMFKSTSGSLYEHIEALCDRQVKGQTIFDWNLLMKDKEKVDCRFGFCFPDVYEIAMSHLGMKILYHLLKHCL